jgi:hypothetical protein
MESSQPQQSNKIPPTITRMLLFPVFVVLTLDIVSIIKEFL